MTTINKTQKLLIVDDEEAILASAKRLFRGKQIELITESSPEKALKILNKQDIDIVISDFRMPGMNGTEFLEQVKNQYPHVTRMMLTGYLELNIIQEAVNRAGVFRFLTKPWEEADLLQSVEAAKSNSEIRKANSLLLQEIGIQNQELEGLTKNLEVEVFKRTEKINESRDEAAKRERAAKELVAFAKNLSQAVSTQELFEVLHQEMWRYQGVSTMHMLVMEGAEKGRIYWMQSRTLHEKTVKEWPDHINESNIRYASKKDKEWWERVMKKQVDHLVAIPVRNLATFFIEHSLKKEKIEEFVERITERLQVVSIVLDKIFLSQQLTKATQQWEATFSSLNDPIAVVDNQERVIRANKKFFTSNQTQCFSAFDSRDELCEGCPMPQSLLLMSPTQGYVKHSSQKVYRVHSYPVKAEEAGGFFVVNHYTDVTRQRDLYLKLVQSEKLAAVGLLAGNIAHELSNPLSGMKGMSQILKKEVGEVSSHYQDFDEIEKATVRCQDIIKNLLHFSESSKAGKEKVDLNKVIESTLPLLKTAIRYQTVITEFDDSLPLVSAAGSQLQQVFFNLINNACQAMPQEGGTVTIKTGHKEGFVYASIADTGSGISTENLKKIFDPFFTTKQKGEGTGLGLSVTKNIIEAHKGELLVESEQGFGTTFTVRLPVK